MGLSIWIMAAALFGQVEVRGDTSCPTPAAVKDAWRDLRVAGPGRIQSVELASTSGGVRLRLVMRDEEPATREILAQGSCDDLARAIAVVLASAEEAPEGAAPDRVELHAKPPVSRVREVPVPTSPARRGAEVVYDVSAAFVADWASTTFSPAGELAARVGSARLGVGGRASVFGAAVRSEALAGGALTWARIGASLGPSYRVPLRSIVALDVNAEVALAALQLEGHDLVNARRVTAFDAGLGAGLRVAIPWRMIAAVVELSVRGWPTSQLGATGTGATAQVPSIEAHLGVGLAFGRFAQLDRKDRR